MSRRPEAVLRLAALHPDRIRSDDDLLADYVEEVAQLHGLPRDEVSRRFHRFLDVYHRGLPASDDERAAIHSGDVEHSFIRVSKPWRYRHFESVPLVLRAAKRHLRSGSARPSVLEFGGGFGNDAIVYANSGFDVAYADITALKNTDVVAQRFAMRGLDIPVYDVVRLPDRRFDVVTAIDVLEHVYDVEETTAQLIARIPAGGLLCCVNAFGAIHYDGDHHDKNRVYLDLFGDLMQAAGFEAAGETPPVEIYRRSREPEATVAGELRRLRRILYGTTARVAEERCRALVAELARDGAFDATALPVADAHVEAHDTDDEGPAPEAPVGPTLGARIYTALARRAPGSLKRAVWRRRLEAERAAVRAPSGATDVLGALADWTAVLRIAEHRLRGLGGRPS